MKPYRTTPPPPRGDLVRWACYEAATWPATAPQGCYVYWVRFAEERRASYRPLVQTKMGLVWK